MVEAFGNMDIAFALRLQGTFARLQLVFNRLNSRGFFDWTLFGLGLTSDRAKDWHLRDKTIFSCCRLVIINHLLLEGRAVNLLLIDLPRDLWSQAD